MSWHLHSRNGTIAHIIEQLNTKKSRLPSPRVITKPFMTLMNTSPRSCCPWFLHVAERGYCSKSINISTCIHKHPRMPRYHSHLQRLRSFCSAPRTVTSGQVQRHCGFEWICKHHRLRPEPIRFVRLDSEHAQSDRKSVNRGLPLLDPASVQRSRFLVLTKRIVVSGDKNARMKKNHNRLRMSSILHPTDFAFFLLL